MCGQLRLRALEGSSEGWRVVWDNAAGPLRPPSGSAQAAQEVARTLPTVDGRVGKMGDSSLLPSACLCLRGGGGAQFKVGMARQT